ncbi:hypothetical protein C8R44DRAFT_738574 [Mycena epipterygia]|nr:hypothetical protein C8R44DRAFT_738574 [Mycena epipterygia]
MSIYPPSPIVWILVSLHRINPLARRLACSDCVLQATPNFPIATQHPHQPCSFQGRPVDSTLVLPFHGYVPLPIHIFDGMNPLKLPTSRSGYLDLNWGSEYGYGKISTLSRFKQCSWKRCRSCASFSVTLQDTVITDSGGMDSPVELICVADFWNGYAVAAAPEIPKVKQSCIMDPTLLANKFDLADLATISKTLDLDALSHSSRTIAVMGSDDRTSI